MAFFESYLPVEIGSRLDWETLQLQPGTYTDEALRGCESDLLYAVQIDQHPILLYCLFEHQSTPDALQGTLIGKAVLLALKASRQGLHHELPRILRLLAEVMPPPCADCTASPCRPKPSTPSQTGCRTDPLVCPYAPFGSVPGMAPR